LNATQTAGAHGPRIPFVSTCPRCGYLQAQWYTPSVLLRLLDRGHPVEAYCAMCDLFWKLTAHELDNLAEKLAVNRRIAGTRSRLGRRFVRPLLNVVRLLNRQEP
jgi:hypothetical protein